MNEAICQTGIVADNPCRPSWKCPYCEHSLSYRIEHEDVAKLAMVSHLSRCHGTPCWHFVVNMKPLKKAAEEYFNAGKAEWTAGYLRPEV